METIYFYCAAIGGGILVLQTLLLVLGATDLEVDTDITPDGDATLDGASDGIFAAISFKTLVAFATFFGLTGLACLSGGVGNGWTIVASIGAGMMAFYLVAYLMKLMISLQTDGNVKMENAIGLSAQVDLRIPGDHGGFGKIRVAVQGRTINAKAVTGGGEIPTGAEVTICGMRSHDTFEVETPTHRPR